MAGKMKHDSTNTTSTATADPGLARAYCEGRDAQIAGLSTNPHASGSEEYVAWQDGYDTVTPEGLIDGCSACIPITVPDVVGDSQAVATAAIIAASLIVGSVTYLLGDVTAQSPAAGAKVQRNAAISLTLTAPVEVPDVVGMTEAEATTAITGAGLVLGTVTLTTGVVTIQDPVATTLVSLASAVDITLTS